MTATLIQASGTMARRDQPRASRQCRKIRVSTMPLSESPTGTDITPKAFSTAADPWTSSRLAGQPGPQPLVRGFQNNRDTRLWPVFHA